ncbi:dolichyl pyrophosphate Man9GlcNAc2 alpha-1,3-glucosyltransferase [Trichinella spiralis]|uniref:dolichyl pyrophosphate Man9GlcNAc2 alpha-1,3-glucosyltransferase n=1 Tax=Trichinella spiralis TaxID=6334 RepID=UPI0001EFB3BF|nr:dolichyl pyrophosphate Man9GlcNAc2 alpha-1,3-glucosyltransferase [Trichinella spiralis]
MELYHAPAIFCYLLGKCLYSPRKKGAASTLISILPGCITLLTNPTTENFNRCSFISSLSFFLFSYHVHEKSILIPAVYELHVLPVTILQHSALLSLKSPTLTVFTFLLTSAISLFPLCVKDGLTVAFFSLTFMFYCLIVNTFETSLRKNESIFEFLWKILFHASFWGASAGSSAEKIAQCCDDENYRAEAEITIDQSS